MDMFLSEGRNTGARVLKRWWEQESIDVEGIKEAAQLVVVVEAEMD